jgi:toxin YoeB
MKYLFTERGFADYCYWADQDRKMLRKLNRLIVEASRSPFEGIGKPEPLRHEFSGYWSRRIDGEHRLVYRVKEAEWGEYIEIVQCRFHY